MQDLSFSRAARTAFSIVWYHLCDILLPWLFHDARFFSEKVQAKSRISQNLPLQSSLVSMRRNGSAKAPVTFCCMSCFPFWTFQPFRPAAVPKLTYLDFKYVAEPIRLALYIGKVDFEDIRVSRAQVKKMGQEGLLPYGQVPILELDGETYAQGGAILRWAGRQSGLYPEDEKLQLRCDGIEDALSDIKRLLYPVWHSALLGHHPVTKEFFVRISDDLRAETLNGLQETTLPYRFRQLERVLEKSGGPYFGGEQMMVCDLSFYVPLLHCNILIRLEVLYKIGVKQRQQRLNNASMCNNSTGQ